MTRERWERRNPESGEHHPVPALEDGRRGDGRDDDRFDAQRPRRQAKARGAATSVEPAKNPMRVLAGPEARNESKPASAQ